MRLSALPRPFVAVSIAAALALLAGCNPCDYTVNPADSLKRPVQTLGSSPAAKEAQDRVARDYAEAEAKMSPEQRAARENIKRKMQEQSAQRQQAVAAGPSNTPYLFRKATLTECSMRYSIPVLVWLTIALVLAAAAHVVLKRITGRGLSSWFSGRK